MNMYIKLLCFFLFACAFGLHAEDGQPQIENAYLGDPLNARLGDPLYTADPQAPVDDPMNDRFYTEFFKMLSVLGLIVLALLMVTWFLKRMLNTRIEQVNSNSLIKVIERRSLTPKTSVYMLEV